MKLKALYLMLSSVFSLVVLLPNVLAENRQLASPEERVKMATYLKDFYKGVKITDQFTENGKLISCIDIGTQPSLNHPDLRNHIVQRKPSPALMKIFDKQIASLGLSKEDVSFPIPKCSENSVPIRLHTLEDVVRFKTLREFQSKPSFSSIESNVRRSGPTTLHQYAAIRQHVSATASQSTINIWAPAVERNNEFSLSQIWLSRGSGTNLETVETGWQVYQGRNGDNLPHFFIYYTSDGYDTTGCYDLTCTGFIQTDTSIVIGMQLPSSVSGGTQQEGTVAYWRDPTTGHWWLAVGEGVDRILVGYYPTSLFDTNGLENFASRITYGGEIINQNVGGQHTATDMGSGAFPAAGHSQAAYQRSLQYMDISQNILDVTPGTTIVDDSLCYDIAHDSNTAWGRHFYYGGTGYNNPDCE